MSAPKTPRRSKLDIYLGIRSEIAEILLQVRILRHGRVERIYLNHARWQSWWKGEACTHGRGLKGAGHSTHEGADRCLEARARSDRAQG